MPNAPSAAQTPADAIAAALAQQTAAQKIIATAAIPLLQQAQTALAGDDVKALAGTLQPIADALPPGNSKTMIKHLLQFISGAQDAIPTDLLTFQRAAAQ